MKTTKTRPIVASFAALVMLGQTATAQILYVDASDTASGNTAIAPSAGGGVFTGIPQSNTPNDGLWDKRAFANGATIFQNASTTAAIDTNATRLVTSLSGLAPNTYDAYAYFWSDASAKWQIGASLSDSAGQLPLFKPGDAGVTQFYSGFANLPSPLYSTVLAQNPFTSSVMIAEGNRRLMQAYLGTFTGSSVSIFIEGNKSMTTFDERTWYDGIGCAVVPEPSVLSLAGCALIALFASRRAKR